MPGIFMWAYDTDNDTWVKVKTDSQGRLYTVAAIDELNDIGDVSVPAPTDGYILYWNDGNSRWECKAAPVGAHKDTHDPEDGADPLDTAIPVKVGAANAIGTSHSLARADHVHEREHAIYTDAAAKAAAVQAGAITNAVTKAPTHDAVFDVKATADAALPAVDKYTNAEAKAAAVRAGAITDTETKAPTHDAVFDVKTTADAAQPAATDAAAAVTAMGAKGDANPLHHDRYADAEAVDAIEADGNLPVASITFIIDGGGEAITTGIKGALEIPFACTINRVTLLADQLGSIVIDIWKQAYADYPPEVGESIVAAAPPTLSGVDDSQDSVLDGWTTAIAAGDCLKFNVDSIATCTWVTLSLKVTKT